MAAHVQVPLHVPHVAAGVALVAGVRTAQILSLLFEVEEELLHDSVLRDAYGKECMEGW